MTIASRLGRLTPTLTARERAKLVLRADRDDREIEPDVRAVPAEQIREYNHYIGLGLVANNLLGWTAEVLAKQVDVIEERMNMPRVLEEVSVMVAEDLEEQRNTHRIRAWRKRKNVATADFLFALSVEAMDDIRDGAVLRWQELRCVELVWAEIAEVLDGDDIVKPSMRRNLEATKERVRAVVAGSPRHKLREPDEELVDDYRAVVENVMRSFGLWEWR